MPATRAHVRLGHPLRVRRRRGHGRSSAPFVRLRGRTCFRHRLARTGRTSSPRGGPTSSRSMVSNRGATGGGNPIRSAGAGRWPAPPPSTGRPLADLTSLILTANCDTVCFGHGDHLMVFDVGQHRGVRRLHGDADADPRHRTHRPDPAGAARDPRPHRRRRLEGAAKTIAELRDKAFFIRPVEKLREKLHSVQGKPSENHPDETPTSER